MTSRSIAEDVSQSSQGIAAISQKINISSGMSQDVAIEVTSAEALSQSVAAKSGHINATLAQLCQDFPQLLAAFTEPGCSINQPDSIS